MEYQDGDNQSFLAFQGANGGFPVSGHFCCSHRHTGSAPAKGQIRGGPDKKGMFKRFKTFLGIGGLPQATPDPSGAGQATGAVDGADHGQVVHMVFGDTPDFVLREAVSFVEEEGHLKLVESKNIYRSSPLLVFCKNNTKLQEDIRHAMENTRRGTDVMLIVVTDKPDLLLLDTIFTENIGAKARLLYDQSRQKYGFTANSSTMKWMRNFLEKFGINVTLKLNRKDSLSKSLTTLLRGEATGSYHVLGDLAEEQLKNVIVFLDDKNVGLAQVEVTAAGSTYPLVLFCAGHQQPEQRIRGFMNNRIDPKDVSAVIIHRESHEVPIPEKVPCTILRLIISDTAPEVLDIAQNRRTVGALRKFLKRRGAPEGRRQAAKPEAVVGPSSFSAEGESPGQRDDDPQGGASSESVAMDWDDRVSQPESPRMPGSVSDYPARAEPPSRNIFSDSFPLQQSEHTQSNSTERYSQHPRSGSYQRQPPEQPTSDIRQPIRHYSAPPPYVAPRPQPSWIEAPGQPLPPVPQQPLHYTDYPYEQSVCQGQLSEIQRYRLSAQLTDTKSNTFSLNNVDRTADTTESVGMGSVPGSSSQRRDLNAGSWSKRRRRRPELPLQVQHGTPTAENGTSTAADCHRERRSKRAVRDRTEGRDSFDYDLAEMFEGMTIGSKRKKTEPYHQRKKEKESKQKQARFWVLHTS